MRFTTIEFEVAGDDESKTKLPNRTRAIEFILIEIKQSSSVARK